MHKYSRSDNRTLGRTATLLLIALLLAVVAIPLMVNGGAAFAGTDDAAKAAITQIAPETQPWFRPLWSPPSHEIETLLFSLQAAAGAGVIGYFFGLRRGRSTSGRPSEKNRDEREG